MRIIAAALFFRLKGPYGNTMDASENKTNPATPPASGYHISSNDAMKIGGTTVGSIAIGAAIGSFVGPSGALAGAIIGGLTGATVSTVDAARHPSKSQ